MRLTAAFWIHFRRWGKVQPSMWCTKAVGKQQIFLQQPTSPTSSLQLRFAREPRACPFHKRYTINFRGCWYFSWPSFSTSKDLNLEFQPCYGRAAESCLVSMSLPLPCCMPFSHRPCTRKNDSGNRERHFDHTSAVMERNYPGDKANKIADRSEAIVAYNGYGWL